MDRADRKPLASSRVAARQGRVASTAGAGRLRSHRAGARLGAPARAPRLGSCAPPRASRGSGITRPGPTRRRHCRLRYSRFTEGFEITDLKLARALLDQVSFDPETHKRAAIGDFSRCLKREADSPKFLKLNSRSTDALHRYDSEPPDTSWRSECAAEVDGNTLLLWAIRDVARSALTHF